MASGCRASGNPVMLVVMRSPLVLHRRNAFLSAPHFLRIGGFALLLMISAEGGLALVTSVLSLAAYISSKIPCQVLLLAEPGGIRLGPLVLVHQGPRLTR